MAKFKFYDGSQWVELAKKTDIPSAVTESTVSDWGFTKNAGTVTSVCSQSPTSGNVSLTHANIGAGNLTVGNGSQYLNMRSGHDSYDGGIYYSTPGNEAMIFAAKNSVTSFIFKSGLSCTSTGTSWQTLTPDLQIKNGKVTINKLIANDANGSYNLDVNGTLNATTIYENGTTLANTYQAKGTYAGTSTATQSANGLMSSADKTKLDGIATNATSVTETTVTNWGFTKNAGTVTSVTVGTGGTNYTPSNGVITIPAYPNTSSLVPYSGATGGVNLGTNAFDAGLITAHSSNTQIQLAFGMFNKPCINVFKQNTYNCTFDIPTNYESGTLALTSQLPTAATTSADGLMSAADKTKLDGIATGATANAGTVTSVQVQAGTGLSSSTSSAQNSSLNTTISIASGYKLPTTTEWGNKADASDLNYLTSAPTSANTSGKIKIVVLSSEPSTKYSGYIYIITN